MAETVGGLAAAVGPLVAVPALPVAGRRLVAGMLALAPPVGRSAAPCSAISGSKAWSPRRSSAGAASPAGSPAGRWPKEAVCCSSPAPRY